ncbi:MAG: type II toxin-antitoxin system VapC family toxin [Candidatus Limnocylindrales bacterium]
MFVVEASDYADGILGRLQHDRALVPAIWPLEVANGLLVAARRGRLRASELPRVRKLLEPLPIGIDVIELRTATGEVLEAARAFELTAYDAAYLSLAARHGLALATADARLAAACRKNEVELIS